MHRAVLLATLVLAAALLFACGDGGDPSATPGAPNEQEREATETPQPTTEQESSELGEAPVFLRTLDQFQTLRAGEPYLVIFRVTNGYEAPTLRVVATHADGEGEPVEFIANKAEVGDTESSGTFYPVNVTLPEPGRWTLTIIAGADQVSLDAVAQEAS